MTDEQQQRLWSEARHEAEDKYKWAAQMAARTGAGAHGQHFEMGVLQASLAQALYDLAVLRLEVKKSADEMQALLEKLKS